MAYTKALIWVSMFIVVSMEVLVISLAQSSHTRFLGETTVYQDKPTSTPSSRHNLVILEIQTKLLGKRFRKAGPGRVLGKRFRKAGPGRVIDYASSARAVPTGPDPLHHHNNPTWP